MLLQLNSPVNQRENIRSHRWSINVVKEDMLNIEVSEEDVRDGVR